MSQWGDAFKKGLEAVETKLDAWRNNDSQPFPDALKLDEIAMTIMLYYIERGVNPMSTPTGNDQVAVRNAYYRDDSRGRTRSYSNSSGGYNRRNNYYGNRPRSNSNQSNNRNRTSSTERNTRYCEICKKTHLVGTIGCPNLLNAYHCNEYMQRTNDSELRRQVEDMERQRSRSASSRASQSSQASRGRSNSSDRRGRGGAEMMSN